MTEYAQSYPDGQYSDWYWSYDWDDTEATDGQLDDNWPDAPAAALDLTFLTRMRTVIARENMTLDFSFQDAESDENVSPEFMVQASSAASTASLLGPSLGVLLVFGLFRGAVRRRRRVR